MPKNPPVEVQLLGQSIWLDFIRRRNLHDGDLARQIEHNGILGVTSNPSIFQKAIGGSDDYDAAIAEMLTTIDDPYALYERVAIADIQAACDLFLPVYEATIGRDGYVSFEVSPLIADDTAKTIAEAQRLFAAVDRPNVMIKIPATDAGLPAIEASIAAGININVTLIFSVENYARVAEAYMRGLEQRLDAGGDVKRIASVASFFVSRIDVLIDRMLDNNIRAAQTRGDLERVSLNNHLKGKSAIANAKIAYRRYQDLFEGERFARLRAAGAMVQRVLWASTSVKNPAYPDTLYIDSLIGADTVNTVPPDALIAFKDHGTVAETLIQNPSAADQVMTQLAEVGIDFAQVTQQLQVDGVEAFADSFRTLLEQVAAKRDVLKTGISTRQTLTLGIHNDPMRAALRDLDAIDANRRIWEHDGSLWKDAPAVVSKINDRLGWLDTLKTIDRARLDAIHEGNAYRETFGGTPTSLVLLGMGGSSLAPEVLSQTFGTTGMRFFMLDSTNPDQIAAVESAIDITGTIFIVASKSGGTIETWSFYTYFYEKTGGRGSQFIAITDPGSQLENEARRHRFLDIFLNPADIGGRYSALSYFGLVPAALLGIDVGRLLDNAGQMMIACGAGIPSDHHPGMILGAILGAAAKANVNKLSIVASRQIASFGAWVEQLVAESTGKEGVGILPVVGATAGKPHDYATDRLFVYLRLDNANDPDLDAGITALLEAGFPVITLNLADAYALGGEFFRWEYATAIAGKLLDINPFDEPNVTEAKNATQRLLDLHITEGALPARTAYAEGDGVMLFVDDKMGQMLGDLCTQHRFDHTTISGLLAAQINATQAGDYFGLLAYLPYSETVDQAMDEIRRRLRHVTRRAVTTGYGPRYLHSTGQLHKGGANNGIFLVITADASVDLAIPAAPYTFGTLHRAQALGDVEALQAKGRRVIHLHSADRFAGLDALLTAIDLAGERRQ